MRGRGTASLALPACCRYQEWHRRQAHWDRAVFIVIWLSIVVASGFYGYIADERITMHVLLIAAFSGVILSLAHGMVYVCRSLSMMIDSFCCDVVGQMSPKEVAHVWNLTQAVLRKASISVEKCLLVLGLVLAIMVPLLLVDAGILGTPSAPPPSLLPSLFVTCGILYMLFFASTITEQCSRVPSLINAISFGEGTELERQHTVDYITNSAAGFYLFGMRLTTAVVVKFIYFWVIVVMGVITKLGSSDTV